MCKIFVSIASIGIGGAIVLVFPLLFFYCRDAES